jgi:hypothetical protein
LLAAQRCPGAFADKAAIEALEAVQPRAEIAVEWNQERAAMYVAVPDQPDSMTAIRIVGQGVTTVIGVDAHHDRQECG